MYQEFVTQSYLHEGYGETVPMTVCRTTTTYEGYIHLQSLAFENLWTYDAEQLDPVFGYQSMLRYAYAVARYAHLPYRG